MLQRVLLLLLLMLPTVLWAEEHTTDKGDWSKDGWKDKKGDWDWTDKKGDWDWKDKKGDWDWDDKLTKEEILEKLAILKKLFPEKFEEIKEFLPDKKEWKELTSDEKENVKAVKTAVFQSDSMTKKATLDAKKEMLLKQKEEWREKHAEQIEAWKAKRKANKD